jgi:hypothetical protein
MPARLPTDCLLARICGRRAFLIRDWEHLLLTRQPLEALRAAPWRQKPVELQGWAHAALQQEYFWIFSRMDEPLRRATAAFFWLAEVRTLSLCLRLLAGNDAQMAGLLKNSLLANGIRAVFLNGRDTAAVVAGLTVLFAEYDGRFGEVAEIWHRRGYGAFEAAMQDISLTIANTSPNHPAMRSYVGLLIDSRNLISLAKRLRWRIRDLPHLLTGGTLSLSRLTGLFEQRDTAGLCHLAMRLGGEAHFSENKDLERILYEAQTRAMRRLARQADGVGAVLDYLWRCGNEAANISLLECLDRADSEAVSAELRR